MKNVPIYSFILLVLLFGCSSDNGSEGINQPVVAETNLISATKIADLTIEQLEYSHGFVFAGVADFVASKDDLNPVTAYRIVYETQNPYFPSVRIQASGLVLIPDTAETLPLVSYQHGTISETDQVPSNFVEFSTTRDQLSVFSGLGYIVIAPDYLGYGSSGSILHPYEHASSLALSSYDMLLATKDFLNEQTIDYSEELFLTGYSEGGFATMAMHQFMEQNTTVPVTASVVGGGAYNKTQFSKEIMQIDDSLLFIPNYLWVLFTYNNIYNIDEPFSFYINEPYATMLGNNPLAIFSVEIENNPQLLFTETFRNLVLNQGDHPMVDAIADNNRYDWSPKSSVYMMHGKEDNFVFPSNATSAYEAMSAAGQNENITLNLLDNSNHFHAAAVFSITLHQILTTFR